MPSLATHPDELIGWDCFPSTVRSRPIGDRVGHRTDEIIDVAELCQDLKVEPGRFHGLRIAGLETLEVAEPQLVLLLSDRVLVAKICREPPLSAGERGVLDVEGIASSPGRQATTPLEYHCCCRESLAGG